MRDSSLLWILLAVIGVALLALLTSRDGSVAGLPDGQFAQLAYYGAWGVGIGASLFLLRSVRLGEALRHAAIWAGVFLVTIAGYAFAPELLAVKNRMMAVLVPGSVVALPSDGERRQYMAVRGSDGHFHLSGTVDGESVSFMVDTGASVIAMDRAMAQSLGIDTDALSFSDFVQTANGIARSAPVFLDSIRIGDIERRNIRAAVTDAEGLDTILLGMSFLNTLTSYDFRGDTLILTD
ncbi:TIGR02281 family clan AA aspartic protease [Fulvimarina sp. 2208YS6-2-32]|uniref:TIGR02281 family clan AA aspartic protease n=1 Tax=Fulvimarina uroteuthidis TaxID=3098149 RepID=A0ABU5I3R5_9HYPH|nr:TIGR02281 family clan AA aspartic protease [Fulvimarina sp. 2208YS6-2-32]MDY8110027.1 TIGR02281 family clan AA aspartic protease [Fulvimarina sp. 2208YS6-2-32]